MEQEQIFCLHQLTVSCYFFCFLRFDRRHPLPPSDHLIGCLLSVSSLIVGASSSSSSSSHAVLIGVVDLHQSHGLQPRRLLPHLVDSHLLQGTVKGFD